VLTAEQRRDFDERGFVRLAGAFPPAAAAAMRERLWEVLSERYGARPGDPASWSVPLVTGLRRFRTHSVFQAVGSPVVLEAIDGLLGAGRYRLPRHWGQFLISFPSGGDAWTVPSALWHTDYGLHLAGDRLRALLVFSFLSDVPPRAGGTAVVVGSHRLVERFAEEHPRQARLRQRFWRPAFLRSDPWLAALASDAEPVDRVRRFMEREAVIAGVPVRVVELVGEAGDVILGHPWLLHSPAPNCGAEPRFMRVQRIAGH
jgi:hypothetical protein